MSPKRTKGKFRSKNTRRRIKKAKRQTMQQMLKTATQNAPKELAEAKTIADTRQAITILKLLGSIKPEPAKPAQANRKFGKKFLLHPLPPKSSIMAASIAMAWAIITITSAFGQWSQMPLPNSVLPVQQKQIQVPAMSLTFNPTKYFNNALASLEQSSKEEINQLAIAVSEIKSSWPQNDFTIAYNQKPAVEKNPPQQGWAPHTQKLSQANIPLSDPLGKVLGAHTTKNISEFVAESETSSLSEQEKIKDSLNFYLAKNKSPCKQNLNDFCVIVLMVPKE